MGCITADKYLKINRKDFGIDTELPLDGRGVVIGDTVQIALDIEACW